MYIHKHISTAVLLLCAIAIANPSNEIASTLSRNDNIVDAINTPKLLNYQGKLTNLAGNPVPDSTYAITFRLYNSPSGGSAFWTETQNVQTNGGIFNVLLGSNTAIDTLPQNGNCYLEMQVNPNPPMTPRIRLVSAPYSYLAKKSDTANYALSANVQYVDSARISTNSHKLQGKDTLSLSNKFVDEGQTNAITNLMIVDNAITSGKIQDGTIQLVDLAFTPATRPLTPPVSNTEIQDNAVTSAKIQDGTILRQDVASNFKAPFADTSDYARNVNIQYVDSARISVNAHNAYKLQGKDTISLDTRYVNEGQVNSVTNPMISGNAITSDKILDGTITRSDVSPTFKAPLADTADYARYLPGAIDSARVSANAHKLQGKDTIALSAKFVDEGQTNSISSSMIIDNTITNSDISATAGISDTKLAGSGTLITNLNADLLDGNHASEFALTNHTHNYVDSTRISVNSYNSAKLQGKDTTALDSRFVNEGQINSVSSQMIIDGTITRSDVTPNFKAPLADTADYARMIPGAIDSARVAANAHKLQGKDTLALSNKFVDEGQPNSITSAMITDGTIVRNDVTPSFKAPFSDTADYARSTPPVGVIDSARIAIDAYNAFKLQGKDTIGLSNKFIDEGQTAGGDLTGTYPNPSINNNAITTGKILNNTILREDVATNFKAPYADTADYVRNLSVNYVDSARISTNAHKLQGKDTIALSAKFVDEGQPSSVNSTMIQDLTITNADISNVAGIFDVKLSGTGALITNLNADMLDGQHAFAFALTGHTHTYIDSSRISANAHKLQGKDTVALSAKFVDEGQINSITTGMITDGNVTMSKINQASATTGQVIKWTGSAWAPSNDSIGSGVFLPLAGGTMTGAISSTGDPEIKMGKANFGSGNLNPGTQAFVAGSNNKARGNYSVVAGGGGPTAADSNSAIGFYSVVSGGSRNRATGEGAIVSGGGKNYANEDFATISGGENNTVIGSFSSIGGGSYNYVSAENATISGGFENIASGSAATIGGGLYNKARGNYAVVAGGGGPNQVDSNAAIGNYTTISGGIRNRISQTSALSTIGGGFNNSIMNEAATISGGSNNSASGLYSTIGGGHDNTSSNNNATVSGGSYNIASGGSSTVGGGDINTASGSSATISGGYQNLADGNTSTVSGGGRNKSSNYHSTVSGGYENIASGYISTVSGGGYNRANGNYSVVSGGGGVLASDSNTAVGHYSVIPGGRRNSAIGNYSFASGRRAKANHHGTFVWADSTDADFISTANNQFLIRANGNVGINTNSPGYPLTVNGVIHTTTGGVRFPDGTVQTTAGGNGTVTSVGTGAGLTGGPITTSGTISVANNGITTVMIADTNVTLTKIQRAGATSGQVIKWTGTAWAPSNDSIGSGVFLPLAGGNMTGAITSTGDPEITMGKANFGSNNLNPGIYAFVAGRNNRARGNYSVVSGGGGSNAADSNSAIGDFSTIGGGNRNIASGYINTIGGGYDNRTINMYSTISGGYKNRATNHYSTVSGGSGNVASGENATISGGVDNIATNVNSTVSGGQNNKARGDFSVIAGGGGLTAADSNSAIGVNSTISGGKSNVVTNSNAVIGGGEFNKASGYNATVSGGGYNQANQSSATVSGGSYNTANNIGSTVSGGLNNTASGYGSVISGGSANSAQDFYSTVGGGYADTVKASYGGVLSGYNNLAGDEGLDTAAVVIGGRDNRATGRFSTVSGGILNSAAGDFSFAAGRRAKANHSGSFVWADGTNSDFASSAVNEFNIRASGGSRIFSNTSLTAGVTLAAGASAWSSVSDRDMKRNIRPVNTKEILDKLSKLEINKWSYKSQDPSIEHIGPIAQDFYALFGLGEDDKTISTIDPAGIALAAIQELAKQNQELRAELEELKKEIEKIKSQK